MKELTLDLSIKNYVVFEELLFHSILLEMQHLPRVVSNLFRSSWQLPKEKAIYCFIHVQLEKLPFLEKMEQLNILRQLILRSSIFHLRQLKDKQEYLYLYFDLLTSELNATLAQQENFNGLIRSLNYGYVLLSTNSIYTTMDKEISAVEEWVNWYYLGLKEFLYHNLSYPKDELTESLFHLSFLKQYLSKAPENNYLQEEFEQQYQRLKTQAMNTEIESVVSLL
ncbi:MAG: hypothetical protein AB8G15_00705 [Saprospiraceae bacterium]